MDDALKKVLGSVSILPEIIEEFAVVKNIADFSAKITEYATKNTTNLLDAILLGAVNLQTSDIHLEPQETQVRLRMRIDGLLQDGALLDKTIHHNLLNRLKLLSKIKLNITDRPQDGRFSIAIGELMVEIRTSSLPSEYGESIVMRVLNPKNLMNLESLGLRKDLYNIFVKEISRPNGMLIITGPTGAGKTTTLYAFLMKLQNPEIKIITIEDPIEYHVQGISQTQVAEDKGYNFSEGLKSIIRQDPDVILIGEIRDLETAKIALQSSLTGHLVLTTIHTNDAAGTIPRLIDLGAETQSIAPAIKMIVGQRLVRRACKECSVLEKPSPAILVEIKKGLKDLPKNVELPKDLDTVKIAVVQKKGCAVCNFSGYRGRIAIFEIFLIDDEVEKMILSNPPVTELKKMAVKKGMVTMYQSGLIEVVLGNTTMEEVQKIVEKD